VRGGGAVDLGMAPIAHACRENRRGWGRVRRDGRTTRGVDKRQRCRVEEGRRARGAGTTVDATALSTMVTSLHEGEWPAAHKGVAVGGVGVLLPEIAGEKNGEVFIGGDGGKGREGGAGGR
jgi:hypothetical protein